MLYNKFRPDTFSKIKGQKVPYIILKNIIIGSSIDLPNIYIFAGKKGTGKTTMARIFSRRLNCLNPNGIEPCNECYNCKSSLNGNSTSIIEINGADKNSIDDIREIISNVQYKPLDGKYLIYIIDEVHMLSSNAMNGLLKILEEPPEHALFILCTTEVDKIIETIKSRSVIKLKFNSLDTSIIKEQLEDILKIINIDYDKEALDTICENADGSLRDAISLLENVIMYSPNKITNEAILDVLGYVSLNELINFNDLILTKDGEMAFKKIRDILSSGKSIEMFYTDYLRFLRNLMVINISDNKLLYDLTNENIQKIYDYSNKVKMDKKIILKFFEEISNFIPKLKNSSYSNIISEMEICKLISLIE